MPKFVIDEDMPRSTGKVLQECKYEVKDIRDHGLRGADDEKIYKFAQDNQSVLVSQWRHGLQQYPALPNRGSFWNSDSPLSK